MVREKTVVRNVIRFIDGLPESDGVAAWARKTHGGPHSGGEPDVDACVEGRCVKLEVKVPERRGRVTKLQQRRLDQWASAGAVVGVVCSAGEARQVLVDAGLVPVDSDGG